MKKMTKIINYKTNQAIIENSDLSIKELVEKAVKEGISLAYADLEGANLEGACLYKADLRCANLKGANLSYAGFYCANLSGADIESIKISHADEKYFFLIALGVKII